MKSSGGPTEKTDTCNTTLAFRKPYFSPKEVAEILGVPLRTWQGIEARGEGPLRIKIGRSVRYARSDLAEWIKQQAQRSPQDR